MFKWPKFNVKTFISLVHGLPAGTDEPLCATGIRFKDGEVFYTRLSNEEYAAFTKWFSETEDSSPYLYHDNNLNRLFYKNDIKEIKTYELSSLDRSAVRFAYPFVRQIPKLLNLKTLLKAYLLTTTGILVYLYYKGQPFQDFMNIPLLQHGLYFLTWLYFVITLFFVAGSVVQLLVDDHLELASLLEMDNTRVANRTWIHLVYLVVLLSVLK